MDKVRFSCPRCSTMMQTGSDKVGYDVACPNCAHRFKLIESEDRGSSQDDVTLPPTSKPLGNSGSSGSALLGQSRSPSAPYPTTQPGNVHQAVAQTAPKPQYVQSFSCPYCQTTRPPIWKSEVSTVGWIIFVILLLTTCFGCVVGLFVRNKYRICSQCKIRLG